MTDFAPRQDVQAISHLNVVVDDIEVATEFYGTVLGFEPSANADGPMDYPGVDLASFARDAGFGDGRVGLHVRFLKHREVGMYLELFTYQHPKGDQTIHRRNTNDLGGIRHVALEVPDAVAAYEFIRFHQEAYGKRDLRIEILGQDHTPEEITPFPYKFFYWIDPWGVQWEMEQGRPVDRAVKGIVG
jgi:catechol 2,3-dioxygenase-like lactoylglutathione lyase family enzyme